MGWRAGVLSGDPDHEIHDELWTPDDRRVAVLERFASNPTIYYCNAITPAGERQPLPRHREGLGGARRGAETRSAARTKTLQLMN